MRERISVEDVELSVRTYNCLKNAGINYLEDLRSISEKELLETRGFGRQTLNELLPRLKAWGICLRVPCEYLSKGEYRIESENLKLSTSEARNMSGLMGRIQKMLDDSHLRNASIRLVKLI